jgi:hypothetical protein
VRLEQQVFEIDCPACPQGITCTATPRLSGNRLVLVVDMLPLADHVYRRHKAVLPNESHTRTIVVLPKIPPEQLATVQRELGLG